MAAIRVYADTSVFGGVFDNEFDTASRLFFNQVESGRFNLITSALVHEEIATAPRRVRDFFVSMLDLMDIIDISEAALELRQAYIESKIVSPQWGEDALHVALSTIAGCSLIVSWNFKHIVHFEKIPLYNAVNTRKGYSTIGIFSPLEVVQYES